MRSLVSYFANALTHHIHCRLRINMRCCFRRYPMISLVYCGKCTLWLSRSLASLARLLTSRMFCKPSFFWCWVMSRSTSSVSLTHMWWFIFFSILSVLLSGIINTVAPSGRRFSISKRISQGSRLRPLDSSSADYRDIKDLLEDLLKNLYPAITDTNSMNRGKPRLRSLKRRIWTLLSEADEETARYTILQIVSQVLLWIELGQFVSSTSEHVYVSSWCTLFNILLLDTSLRAIP